MITKEQIIKVIEDSTLYSSADEFYQNGNQNFAEQEVNQLVEDIMKLLEVKE